MDLRVKVIYAYSVFMGVAGGYDADPEECGEGLEGITAGAVGADETARGGPRGRRAGTMGDDQRAGLKKVRVVGRYAMDRVGGRAGVTDEAPQPLHLRHCWCPLLLCCTIRFVV